MRCAEELIAIIEKRRMPGSPFLVAIDGRCGSGKSTLAKEILQRKDYSLLPMDDFFLRPEQRTTERLATPGENVDHERILPLLQSLKAGQDILYQPYSCREQKLLDPVLVPSKEVILIEGSYSHHPLLLPFYDLTIFMDIDPVEQLRRLEKRIGKERLQDFIDKWIPLEEKYFAHFRIKENSDIVFPR